MAHLPANSLACPEIGAAYWGVVVFFAGGFFQ
jgi:hypothetical protein